MTKHTPGPWNHGRMLLSPKTKDRRCGFVINGPDESDDLPTRICDLRVPRGVSGFSEGEANARLIASAPDLLAALEAWVDSTSLADETGSMRPVYLAARAAIAKATGDSADNAGCDECGTFDRVDGSKLCEHCKALDDAVRSVVNGDDDAVHISYSEPDQDHRTPLEALRYHVSGAIERGEGVAITEQRVDAKITELIRDVKDGDCALSAIFDDGSTRKLFSFFIDELAFFDADLLGKNETEAHQLHHARTIAYIQS